MARYRIIKLNLGYDDEYFIEQNGETMMECSSSLKRTIRAKKTLIQLDKRIMNIAKRRLIQQDKQRRKN